MNAFKTVSVNELDQLLDRENSLLLDCRLITDYKQGHMENALHAHDGLVESLIRKGNKTQPMIIYCYHGHNSQHLAELFANFGFTDVYSVDGGYEEWLATQHARV